MQEVAPSHLGLTWREESLLLVSSCFFFWIRDLCSNRFPAGEGGFVHFWLVCLLFFHCLSSFVGLPYFTGICVFNVCFDLRMDFVSLLPNHLPTFPISSVLFPRSPVFLPSNHLPHPFLIFYLPFFSTPPIFLSHPQTGCLIVVVVVVVVVLLFGRARDEDETRMQMDRYSFVELDMKRGRGGVLEKK